ncbi:hypothetical protein CLU79DRAFT_771307 [Phycomyces nitens]|nr:hypothetical protein CLU79DRAFT_771307 [Phycomyces nitens]
MTMISIVESPQEQDIYPERVKNTLLRMLTGLKDGWGNPMVIGKLPPTFASVFVEPPNLSDQSNPNSIKSHAFVGISALKMIVSIYLAKKFSWADQEDLERMLILIFTNSKFQTLIGNKFNLDEYWDGTTQRQSNSVIINNFIGVLYEYNGLSTVERWITPFLDLLCPYLLKPLPKTLYNKLFGLSNELTERIAAVSATGQLITYVNRAKGTIVVKENNNTLFGNSLGWGVDILYKLSPTSEWYTHSRHGISKKKARELAFQDILAFYKKNPDLAHIHQLPSTKSDQSKPNTLDVLPKDYTEDMETNLSFSMDQITKETPEIAMRHKNRTYLEPDADEATMIIALMGDVSMREIKQEEPDNYVYPSTNQNKKAKRSMISPPFMNQYVQLAPVYKQADLESIKTAIHLCPKLDIFLKELGRHTHPKVYIQQIKNFFDTNVDTTYERSGPMHSLVFDATCTYIFQGLVITTHGRGTKKSDSETQAYQELVDLLME